MDFSLLYPQGREFTVNKLTDEAVKGMLASIPNFNAEEILKSLDEAMTEEHIPDVKVDVYGMNPLTITEDSSIAPRAATRNPRRWPNSGCMN